MNRRARHKRLYRDPKHKHHARKVMKELSRVFITVYVNNESD